MYVREPITANKRHSQNWEQTIFMACISTSCTYYCCCNHHMWTHKEQKSENSIKKTFHYRTEVTPKIEKYNLFTYKRHTAKPLNCFIHRFMHHLQKQLFFFLGREYRCMRKYYIVRKETIRVTISMAFSYVLRFLFFSDVSSSSILFEKSQFSLH